jgi:hypothetical protein
MESLAAGAGRQNHLRHAASKKFEAIVDTGSDYCLFHSSVGEAIGIKLREGLEGDLGAVVAGPSSKVY